MTKGPVTADARRAIGPPDFHRDRRSVVRMSSTCDYLLRGSDTAEAAGGGLTKHRAPAKVCVRGWNVVQRGARNAVSIVQSQRPEFCLTQSHSIRQHGLKYRLQLAGRSC